MGLQMVAVEREEELSAEPTGDIYPEPEEVPLSQNEALVDEAMDGQNVIPHTLEPDFPSESPFQADKSLLHDLHASCLLMISLSLNDCFKMLLRHSKGQLHRQQREP